MSRTTLFTLALATSLGCGAPQVNVAYRAAPDQDFGALHTYAWAPEEAPGDHSLRSPALNVRVRVAVDEALAAHGFEEAPVDEAQVWVYWYAAMHAKTELRKLDYTQSAPLPERTEDVFEQGTLIVDLVDRERQVLLWRARAQARLVPDASDEERNRRVRAAVQQMFESYPPP